MRYILKKHIILSILFSFCLTTTLSQVKISITGSLKDSIDNAIPGANILLITTNDTIRGVSSDNGYFKFTTIKHRRLKLHIKSLGYKEQVFTIITDTGVNYIIAPIILKAQLTQLKDVVIAGKTIPVNFKKDTIEFNANAFRNEENELIDEVLKRMPGLSVNNYGELIFEGTIVKKLRVNGKDFFSGNVKEFIRQLPANIIDKIQVINDYGDQAAFSGIKSDKPLKQLNLVTKPGVNKGLFGDLNVLAATNNRIGALGSGNFWRNAKQISSSIDLNLVKDVIGINRSNKISSTYNDEINKSINFTSNYTYSNNSNSSKNQSFSTTTLEYGTIDNAYVSVDDNNSRSHNFNGSLIYHPLLPIYLKGTLEYQNFNSRSSIENTSLQTGLIKQDLISSIYQKNFNKGVTLGLEFVFKFKRVGRVLAANFNYNTLKLSNEKKLNDLITYYSPNQIKLLDSALNRFNTNFTTNKSTSVDISYSEMLSKTNRINIKYSLFNNSQNNDITVYKRIYGRLDKIDSLSTIFPTTFLNHQFQINHILSNKNLFLSQGIIVINSTNYGKDAVRGVQTKNSVINISPIVNFNYSISSYNSFDVTYNGTSTPPTTLQLQPVPDLTNVQNSFIGNTNLKSSFEHNIDLHVRHYGRLSNQTIVLGFTARSIRNKIATNTLLILDTLNNQRQITTFENTNGYYSFTPNYNYDIPIKFFNIDLKSALYGSFSIAKDPFFDNSKQRHTISKVFMQGFKVGKYAKNFSVFATTQYNRLDASLKVENNNKIVQKSLDVSLNSTINLKKNFSVSIDGNGRFFYGYTNLERNQQIVLNLSVIKKLLENNSMQIKLNLYDLLNQTNIVSQSFAGNLLINSSKNFISRYFLLTIGYKLSKFN